MKLLQIINSLGAGGAEALVANTSIRYKQAGIDVSILVLDPTVTPLYNNVKAQDIPIHTINAKGKGIYNPINSFKLAKYLKQYPLVHAHLFPASYWVALAKVWGAKNTKLIFTEHNTTNRRRNSRLFKHIDRWVYKQFNAIVSISDAVDSSLKNYLGEEFHDAITKIYNGVDVAKFNMATPYPKVTLGVNSNDVLLIQVASFTPQKDQSTLIKALKHLPEHIKVLLVGTGPLLSDTEQLVKDLELQARVLFLGIRDDVPKLLKTADIVVLASHYEGLSLSCIEGMASGKPFVASNTPGLGDIVKNYGIIFNDKDNVELAKIIARLKGDSNLYNRTVEKCLSRAKDFDIKIMIQNHIELYNKLSL